MKLRDIPRTGTPSRLEFAAYMKSAEAPWVITGAMDDWPAMQAWSCDFFAEEFADFPVSAFAPQFPALAKWGVKTTLASYVAYLRDPDSATIDGTWIKGEPSSLKDSGLTLYAGNFNPAHPTFGKPDLIFRYVPRLPDFIDSWMGLLQPQFRAECETVQSHYYVYLSVPGGVTPLHYDFWSTHAFLAQIAGCKEAILFRPELTDELCAEPSGDVRKMMADPKYSDVEGWRAELAPGDMLIMPAGWLHYVETLETSITYSADWIDVHNWRAYVSEATKTLARRRERKS